MKEFLAETCQKIELSFFLNWLKETGNCTQELRAEWSPSGTVLNNYWINFHWCLQFPRLLTYRVVVFIPHV